MVQISREWQTPYLLRYRDQFPPHFSFEVLAGWEDLLSEMFRRVDLVLAVEDKAYFQWSDIKEKFGTLRAPHNGPDAVDDIVDWAEAASAMTCDCCGRPGRLVREGWLATRCGRCG